MSDVGEINLEALTRGGTPVTEALARAISLSENGELSEAQRGAISDRSSQLPITMRERIGITGSPGVGKSTLTGVLIGAYREMNRKVAVLAVDPSSVITGGALLGDRIRMHDHYLDPGVFIRSMSARGHLGGLSVATPIAAQLCALAGFSPVLIETVGVGQSEVEVMSHVDTTLVVLAPGAGDDIQSAKAGIMEIADIFIINKVDRDRAGAEKLRQEILRSQEISSRSDGWKAPVLLVSALDREGIPEVINSINEYQKFIAHLNNQG